ncbi:cell division protein FtsQ [Blastochloris tepida]|uniref:Cell division protein FtsQ n=1 Tax=Blastochloris tepida TaxID=2233851 RepID=A0A348FWB9_9HYPH|nr:cell division protein FtsQ [Blastochloris tepida]
MERVGRRSRKPTPPGLRAGAEDRVASAAPRQAAPAGGPGPLAAAIHGIARRVARLPLPRGAGIYGTFALFLGAGIYGSVVGGHVPAIITAVHDAADAGARAAGFGLNTVTISGRKYLSEAEIRQAAGIGPGTSLLFLDAVAAREGLLAVPWIAEAQVRKLYPDRVDIEIVEREAFAFWQLKGKVQVIAEDGTVIAPVELAPRPDLPLVVGVGADKRAKGIVKLLAKFPDIAAQTRAAVLVAERRWNLRMKNGIDVRLPETDPAGALAQLAVLDREKKLLSRDVAAIDLRLPDRITVRLSDDAAKAREEAMKPKSKRKGADT